MGLDTQFFGNLSQTSGEFPGTTWLEVTDREKVVQRYRQALRVYLACLLSQFPAYRAEADDLLQEFIMQKILRAGWLEMADPHKGRFRDFLKSSLRHFVAGEVRKREAAKRGGKQQAVSIEELEQELPDPQPSSDSFDFAWLQMLLTEALGQMEKSCSAAECEHIWQIFQVRLLRPALEGVEPLPYDEVITRFGFRSPAQATNALATAKRMFGRHLRAVIAQYESGDTAVRAELESLRLFLSKLVPLHG